tara:strand:- start:1363 stop:1794 length:432 start_codon:yes stop_codon:yes gene_type:complete
MSLKSKNSARISKNRLSEIILEEIARNFLNEADPSMAVQQDVTPGSSVDIYRKGVAALNLWIGSRYIPSQKRWFGDTPKSFQYYVDELFGNTGLSDKILARAARIPVKEIPAYYGQMELQQKQDKDDQMDNNNMMKNNPGGKL